VRVVLLDIFALRRELLHQLLAQRGDIVQQDQAVKFLHLFWYFTSKLKFIFCIALTGCPAGTFNSNIGQSTVTACGVCTEGYYCLTTATISPVICPVNYYCPAGTSNYQSYPCPPGTYTNNQGLTSSTECTLCDPGKYCYGGKSPSLCKPGFYNPLSGGTTNSR
jgi:hypothetical protein